MTELIEAIGYWVHELGIWGYPLAVGLMAGVAVLPIPAEIPAAMNGMLFGAVAGTAITWTGAMAGAVISFELSRRFGRPLAERMLSAAAIARVDRFVQTASWPGMLVARLIPAIAFTALNWGAGLTLVSRRTFVWTTALGILPGTILFVSSGYGLARLYVRHPYLSLALVAAILVVILATRRAQPDLEAVASVDADDRADG